MKNKSTQDRILEASEVLFARKGFHGVGIREVAKKAGVNISAINYYFGSKKNLYIEVFKKRWVNRAKKILSYLIDSLDKIKQPSLETFVETYVNAIIDSKLDPEEKIIHHQLMNRELSHPSEALDVVINDFFIPSIIELAIRLKKILPSDKDIDIYKVCIFCMNGIILYFNYANPIISKIFDTQNQDVHFLKKRKNIIINFIVSGIRNIIYEQDL